MKVALNTIKPRQTKIHHIFSIGDDDHEKQNRRKNLLGKKTDGKKGQKDIKGYIMFDEDDSDESLVTEDVK